MIPKILLAAEPRPEIARGLGEQGLELRQRHTQYPGSTQYVESMLCIITEKQAIQLGQNALPTDAGETLRLLLHSLLGLPIKAKPELRDKSGGAQQAQGVLIETFAGIANGPHDGMRDVGLTTPGIDDFA